MKKQYLSLLAAILGILLMLALPSCLPEDNDKPSETTEGGDVEITTIEGTDVPDSHDAETTDKPMTLPLFPDGDETGEHKPMTLPLWHDDEKP